MKQMKFFLVVLMTVLMGVSVSSCMKSDDNGLSTSGFFVKNNLVSFEASNGIQFIPTTGMSYLTGTYYFIYGQFEYAELVPNATVGITLMQEPVCIDPKSDEYLTSTPQEATNPLHSLSSELLSSIGFYDKNTLILPMIYWINPLTDAEKLKAEIAKHSFILSYDPDSFKESDTKLTLTINHVVNENGDEGIRRTQYTSTFKAYSISTAIYQFKQKTGKLPQYITLKAQTNSTEDVLKKDVEPSSLEIPYQFTE